MVLFPRPKKAEVDTMLCSRLKNWPALIVVAGLLAGPNAMAQDQPKDAAAAAQAKPAGAAAAKDAKKAPEQPKPRVAVFRLTGSVQETPKEEVFNFGGETGIPLETLVSRMDKAAKDSSVKAVVILLDQPTIGSAQVEELREAISRLRAAGITSARKLLTNRSYGVSYHLCSG